MKKLIIHLILFCVFSANYACKKNSSPVNTIVSPPPVVRPSFAKGADVSWLTEMESNGIKFYNSVGAQQDALLILKNLGMNAIRLRVWVNPANGWCNSADVLAKAIRVKNLGMQIMLDFHYSDSWADPGKQNKPAAWTNENITALQASVQEHTLGVLDTLKANGILPKWVQVGNETNNGMLWPEGNATNSMANFAFLVNAGYNAVKSVDTSIKVIVHISNGYDNNLFRWMFDGLQNYGAHWDIIGMSLYPTASNWQNINAQCLANMNDMVSRYNKNVMICEAGMPWNDASACKAFLSDLIAKTNSVAENKGLGVFYWEPEAYNNWQGYTLGAFDNSGKPTEALNAFN